MLEYSCLFVNCEQIVYKSNALGHSFSKAMISILSVKSIKY